MIKTINYATREDGVALVKTESDAGFYIKKNGSDALYSSAIDVAPLKYTYTESDILIPKEEPTLEDYKKAYEQVVHRHD